jgi:ribosomal protein S18 acetylase RimI-like enzyme
VRDIRLRELRAEDRAPIGAILRATGVFYDEEVKVALELIDLALARPDQADYIFMCAEAGGRFAGYACYGPIPMTDRSYDLYWIAVDTALHRSGVGRTLVAGMETDLKERGARKIFVDTSGREAYLPTRRFYEGIGYTVAARLQGFYRAGDDKVVYAKEIQP